MLTVKVKNILLKGGFDLKYAELKNFGERIENVFKKWQSLVCEERPLSYIYLSKEKDIEALYKFATRCARLFAINNWTVEMINSIDISDNYFGSSFFIVYEDFYSCPTSKDIVNNFRYFLSERIIAKKPYMLLGIEETDLNSILGSKFVEAISKHLISVGI